MSAHDTYLETQVTTATPQRLRLMLIEEALRLARAARELWLADRGLEGSTEVARCRDVISELIAGIHPDQAPVAKQVLGIYLYLFSALTESQIARDTDQLAGVIRVLEVERETWLQVCTQFPERVAADPLAAVASEELAPRRVADGGLPAFAPAMGGAGAAPAAFSIEA